MAKLSDVNQNQNPMDSLEALKRRYQRQNRELAKANANQAQQIQALQQEISHQNSENIRLNGEIIHLKKELDAKDASTPLSVNDGTKRLLEEKLFELTELVRGLGDGGFGGHGRKRLSVDQIFPRAIKPERERQEAALQDIPENEATGDTPPSPLANTQKRSEAHFGSPSKGYIPLDSAMFDIRPRRRRDSSTVDNLVSVSQASRSDDDLLVGAKDSNKRKYPDITDPNAIAQEMEDRIVPPRLSDIEEVFSSPVTGLEEQQVYSLPEGTKVFKDSDADVPSKLEVASSPVKLDIANASRFVSSHRRSLENVKELNLAPEAAAPQPEARRALGPKSVNVATINNSPVKLPTAADFEFVKKEKPIPKDRDPVKKANRPLAKPIIVQGLENTLTPEKSQERNRRTRGVTVNYALPALNKKMRRETESLVDAVTGIQPKRRSISTADGTSQNNTPATTPAARTAEERKSLRNELEDLERRASRMTIHHDSEDGTEPVRKRSSIGSEKLTGISEREIRKIMAERGVRERDPRLEEARKDIFDFTMSSSPDPQGLLKRASNDRNSLTIASVSGSHSRRTSSGSAIPSSRRDNEPRAPSSTSTKSAAELLEERRKRRATLGSGTANSLSMDGNKKSVSFAESVQDSRVSSTKEGRRKSMVI